MHITTSFLFILSLLLKSAASCPSPLYLFANHYNCSAIFANIVTQTSEPALSLSPIATEISSLTTVLNKLTTTAKLYDGSLQHTFDLIKIVKEVKLKLGQVTADLGSDERLEQEKERSMMPITILEDMVQGMEEVLEVLVLKAPTVETAGYTSLVSSELMTLSASTDLIFAALARRQEGLFDGGELELGEVKEEQQVEKLREEARAAFTRAREAFMEAKEPAVKVGVDRSQFVRIGMGFH